MRGALIVFAAVVCLVAAGCGDETTIINESTTLAPPPTVAETTPQTTAPATAPAAPAVPEPSADPETLPTDENYSGPCGEAGVITGGTPGPSARTAVPGYANVETMKANCAFAGTVAVQWVEQWDASCVAGCSRRIEGLGCEYAGSGSSVQCLSAKQGVSFDLGFQIE